MTTKTAARKPAAKPAAKAAVPCVLRRIVRPENLRGQYILVLNPKVFGSTENWLGGAAAHFASKDEAIAAAPKLGGRIA